MIQFKKDELLKDTPEYENYSDNEVALSIEEMKELGMLSCGGCCQKKGENSKKSCCKNKKSDKSSCCCRNK